MKARKTNVHEVRETFLQSSSKAPQNMPLRAFDEDCRNVEIAASGVVLRERNVHGRGRAKVSTMSWPRAHPDPLPWGEGVSHAGSWRGGTSGLAKRLDLILPLP